MRPSMNFFAAASLAIGGIAFTAGPPALADDCPSEKTPVAAEPEQKPQNEATAQQPDAVIVERVIVIGVLVPKEADELPDGFERAELDEMDGIRSTFARLAESAFQKDELTHLLQHVVLEDQQRIIESISGEQKTKIDEALTELQRSFSDRHGLDAGGEAMAFNETFTVFKGRLEEPKLLANWPVRQDERSAPDKDAENQLEEQQPALKQDREQEPAVAEREARAEPGPMEQEAAVILFPAEGDLPELYVSLLKEAGHWRIDMPHEINAEEFGRHVLSHLEAMTAEQHTQMGPEQSYRHAAHHIVAALYGIEAKPSQPEKSDPAQPRDGQ